MAVYRCVGGPINGKRITLPYGAKAYAVVKSRAFGTKSEDDYRNALATSRNVYDREVRTERYDYCLKTFRLPDGPIQYLGLSNTSIEEDIKGILLP